MNRNRYRVIFNRFRLCPMAVPEHTRSLGKHPAAPGRGEAAHGSIHAAARVPPKRLSLCISLAIGTAVPGAAPAVAAPSLVADKEAPAHQQPTVLHTANGTPQINIQTPTSEGVSVNQYRRFDLDAQGAVLNNSRIPVPTRLGGWIAGNPWLAAGEARVIVNQINSRDPSRLNGPLEVGGRRAEVIIANPAGIQVNGGGFINADRVILTTGIPQYRSGALSGFRIRSGEIGIAGQGLNAGDTDYTRILSQSARIDGPVWGKDIRIVAGSHDAAADGGRNSVQAAAAGHAPAHVIDTGLLGGMYADKITLIALGTGAGIRNAGQLYAGAGGVTLSADGTLGNSGTLAASGGMTLDGGSLDNSGTIQAARLNLSAGSLNNSGGMTQTGAQAWLIETDSLDNSGRIGARLSADQNGQHDKGGGVSQDSGGNGVHMPSAAAPAGSSGTATAGDTSPEPEAGRIHLSGSLNNSGRISAGGAIALSVHRRLHNPGILHTDTLVSRGDTLDNRNGTLTAGQADLNVRNLLNRNGSLDTGSLNLQGSGLDNRQGRIRSRSVADLQLSGSLDNHRGLIASAQDLRIHHPAASAATLDNSEGEILAGRDLSIQAHNLEKQGSLAAGRDLSLVLNSHFTPEHDLSAGAALSLRLQGMLHNSRRLEGGGRVDIEARAVDNTAQGSIQSGSDTRIQAHTVGNRGLINSNGLTRVQAGTEILNIGTGRIYGDWVAVSAQTLRNRKETAGSEDKAAVIAARSHLAVGAGTIENSEGARLSSEGSLKLGGRLDDGHQAAGSAAELDNHGATIQSQGYMHIAAAQLRNRNSGYRSSHREVAGSRKQISEYLPGQDRGYNLNEAHGYTVYTEADIAGRDRRNALILKDGSTHEDYTRTRYTQYDVQTVVDSSHPGRIVSGGDLSIASADAVNDKSHILAAGRLETAQSSIRNLDDDTAKSVTVKTDARRDWHHVYYDRLGRKRDRFDPRAAPADAELVKQTDPPFSLNIVKTEGRYRGDTAVAATESASVGTSARGADGAIPGLGLRQPLNSLYTVNPSRPDYLIETDPAFTHYRSWLSGSYMLDALQPGHTLHKRLGDGYYEQQRINEQIAAQTGYRRLDGYGSDEEQFKALMDAGITFARTHKLSPGIVLTAAQLARLTSDIVWLEEQSHTLADGSTTTVLAPRVYLMPRPGGLAAHGGVISADTLTIAGSAHLTNQGTLAGRRFADLSAADIGNSGVIEGGRVRLHGQDVRIEGGRIGADTLLAIEAERIKASGSTVSRGDRHNGDTQIGRLAGLYVRNGSQGTLSLKAGESIDLSAADLHNAAEQGQIRILSQGRIDLGTVRLSSHGQQGGAGDPNHRHVSRTAEAGSRIRSAGDIVLAAQEDVNIRQGSLHSEAGSVLLSGRNVGITEGRKTLDLDESVHKQTRKLLSRSGSLDQYRSLHDEAVGSRITGRQIQIAAANDLQISGSDIVSERQTLLHAGRDIGIRAAQNSHTDHEHHRHTRSGVTGSLNNGVAAIGIGRTQQQTGQDRTAATLTVSQIGSIAGNTAVIAGNNLTTQAAVLASGGDLTLQGRNVSLHAGYARTHSASSSQGKHSGITVGATVDPLSAAKAGYDRNMRNGGYSDTALGKTIQRDDALGKAIHAAAQASVFTAGRQKTGESRHSEGTQAITSSATTGGNLNIIATDGSIKSEGAQLTAEGNALLSATESIELGFARDSAAQSGHRKRSGLSIDNREAIPFGSYNDKGRAQGSLDKATGTQLSAGGTAVLQAQKADIDILGSSIAAQDDVILSAGGNINIRATQNSQDQSERQVSSGIGTAVISDTEHFAGWMRNRQDGTGSQVEQVKSQIGSLGGHVNIQAGGNYTQQVADVVAAQDLNITAKSVEVLADADRSGSRQAERDVKIGTFAKISSPLIDLVKAAEGAVKSKADGRTRALQTLAAGAQGYTAYHTAATGGALFKAEAGAGFKTANQSQGQSQSTSQGNVLNAGGNLNIRSTEGSIRLQHTRAEAAGTLSLDSAKNIVLESGQSTQSAEGRNSSVGASVGVGVSVGAQTGVYVYGEVSGGQGSNRYLARSHDHTALKAGNIRLASQGDTTLKGATAAAGRIDADVKGRLHIESVQDQIEQQHKQSGGGVRVQVSWGTAWEASGHFSQSQASGRSESVGTQSGLFAGEGGYHIKADSVHLKGGAIAATAPKEHNELTAKRFTFEHIQNRSSYGASNVSLNGGYGSNRASQDPKYDTFRQTELGQAFARSAGSTGPRFAPSLPQHQQGGDNSTTYATLGEGNIRIGGKETSVQELGIHSDIGSAHRALGGLPDLGKMTDRQQTVAQATAAIISAAHTYSGHRQKAAAEEQAQAQARYESSLKERNDGSYEAYAQLNDNERQTVLLSESAAYRKADTEARDWGIGGSKSRAVSAGTTLITGVLGGQSGIQAAVNTASPYTSELIGRTFGQNGSHPNEALQLLGHALNSGVLAVANGGSFEAGAVSGAGSELAAKAITQTLFGKETAADPSALGEQEKALVKDLSSVFGAASGGLLGGTLLDAQIGGVAGQNAVENNWLHSQTAKQRGWLSQEEIALLDNLVKQSGARSIEYYVQEEQKIHQSNLSPAEKEKALANLKRGYEADSRKMEAAAAKLPQGSKERGQLFTIASKMQGIVSVLPPYEQSEFVRAEQRDWLPTANPVIHRGDSGFVAVQRQWAVNDRKTPEEASFQTEMPSSGRGVSPRNVVQRTPAVKPLPKADKNEQSRERVLNNVAESRQGRQSSKFSQHVQREREAKTGLDFDHFIGGDTSRSGRVTGGHSLTRGDVRLVRQTSAPDKNGVYQATVEIRKPDGSWEVKQYTAGRNKGQPMTTHSMFPADWDEARIRSEVTSAWENRTIKRDNRWEGQSKSGIWIEGFIVPRGTAYPIYGK